ncbi:MAG: TMEM165/GDT1 family protein [Deltaproteobacteria bacterium]|nr:TMEM165/GDT1 family protein [Deltaproteobacteria bacterium]
MDLSLLGKTFVVVFLAELGDKTQLATFGFSASSGGSRLAVFLGAAGALIASSLLAVAAGGLVGKAVSPTAARMVSGALFLVLGVWMLAFAK